MTYKRVLVIQDISCVGQCSMTVALPILSACGHETCILPSAVLSTHTGGFGKPVVCHLSREMPEMARHWQESGISFDAVLVGYLGSLDAIAYTEQIMDSLLAPDGITIVDPAMADHGKRYSGLDEKYAEAMEHLCRKADIILPNITEAAAFSRVSYRKEIDEGYINSLLDGLNHSCVILTGVGFQEKETGILVRKGEEQYHFVHTKLEGSYHGTGDIFAACFAGALMCEKTLEEAVAIAGEFVCRCIENTQKSPAHWYGIKFEPVLPELIRLLQQE